MIKILGEYLAFPFVQYALNAGVLIALSASLLGVPLVLKRFSFLGDGLSHVAFGATAVAAILNVSSDMLVVMPITILSAVLLLLGNRRKSQNGDAVLAMVSVGALAIGYLLMNVFSKTSNLSGDVCSTLFGSTSILTLSVTEVWLTIGMALVVIFMFSFFHNKIFAITFDEPFASATGVPAGVYDLVKAVVTAIVIVLAMNLVGSLLTSALIVFPALTAMRVFKRYRQVILFSAVFSVICAVLGILVSILYSTPVGATIVAVNIVIYLLFTLVKALWR